MKFDNPTVSVYIDVRQDPTIDTDEDLFMKAAVAKSQTVWETEGLQHIESLVETFETEYGEMDASGSYFLNQATDGTLSVEASQTWQYPLDETINHEGEPGSIDDETFETATQRLFAAQDRVAEKLTEQVDDFTQRS